MNIAFLRSLPVGNAVEVTVTSNPGVIWVQVQRRIDSAFTAPDDPTAVIVFNAPRQLSSEQDAVSFLDTEAIVNGVPLFYCAYGHDGTGWIASPVEAVTPEQRLMDRSVDPLLVVRGRLKAGLQAEVAAGRLKPTSQKIPVYTAPPQAELTTWPVVTIKLEADRSAERAIGETIDSDHRLTSPDDWLETEGWLSHVTLQIIGWSQNPDERIALRQALKRIVIGNLPVFAAFGLITPDWNQQDSEDFQTFNAPVYQTVGTFTCLAPSMMSWTTQAIAQIDVIGTGIEHGD